MAKHPYTGSLSSRTDLSRVHILVRSIGFTLGMLLGLVLVRSLGVRYVRWVLYGRVAGHLHFTQQNLDEAVLKPTLITAWATGAATRTLVAAAALVTTLSLVGLMIQLAKDRPKRWICLVRDLDPAERRSSLKPLRTGVVLQWRLAGDGWWGLVAMPAPVFLPHEAIRARANRFYGGLNAIEFWKGVLRGAAAGAVAGLVILGALTWSMMGILINALSAPDARHSVGVISSSAGASDALQDAALAVSQARISLSITLAAAVVSSLALGLTVKRRHNRIEHGVAMVGGIASTCEVLAIRASGGSWFALVRDAAPGYRHPAFEVSRLVRPPEFWLPMSDVAAVGEAGASTGSDPL